MEALRARISNNMEMVPLGKKKKGVIQENLGQTSFKKVIEPPSPDSPPPSRLRKRSKSISDSSDDELDLLSQPSPPPPSSLDRLPTASLKSGASSLKSSPRPNKRLSKPKPKPRMIQSKSKGSSTYFSPPPKKYQNSFKMPPSNQLANDSQSHDDEVLSSPLEELSQNTTEYTKKPKSAKGKRKLEVKEFPMDVDAIKNSLISKRSTENNLAPFPVSPPRKVKTSDIQRKTELAPFPMEIPSEKQPSTSGHNHISLKSNVLSYDGLRPFPMTLPSKPEIKDFSMPTQKEFTMSPDLSSGNNVDPSKLCPYCDELLPEEPSSTLRDLMAKAKERSRKDPRPNNPFGLMAPLTLFAEVCERHRLEMNYLPLAISRGWPIKIDFAFIPDRIRGFKNSLDALITSPETSSFWLELKNDIVALGRKKLASVTGQFATFEKSQPGYYGEQGSIIIQQTLYSLFPPGSIPQEAVEPLSVEQFLSQVLLPEAATILIMEDMKLPSKQQALNNLEESKKYGIAMFPERAQESAISEIGERLAMERALSRRKYLEEIGETEEDITNEIEIEKPRKASKGKKKASISTSSDIETDSSSRRRYQIKPAHEISQQTPKPKPKPKPKPRGHVKDDNARADETPRAVKATVKTNKKRLAVSASTESLIELSSSDDNVDGPWTFGFRGQKHNAGGSQVYTTERKASGKGVYDAADDTPQPKSKSKTKEFTSEPDDSETASKPCRKPKPRPVKRNSRQESFVSGENNTSNFPKQTGDTFNWLLDS